MGHQESFLYCEDHNYLINKINMLGKQWFEDRFVKVAKIVTLDRDLKFDLGEMCRPDIKLSFKAGTKFVWIYGDRSYQRQLYGKHGLFGEHHDFENEIDVFFIECMSKKLFSKDREWMFTWEEFEFQEE